MMKLNPAEIKFIDTYLENSEVSFADIRMEMVDHVASDIESEINAGDTRNFYDIFKDYMLANKAALLKNNKQFIKATDKKLLKLVFRTMLSWQSFVFFVISFLSLYVLASNLNHQNLHQWFSILPIMSFLILGATYFGYLRILKLDRFSAIERMGFVYFICFHVFHLASMMSKNIFEKLDRLFMVLFINSGLLIMFSILMVTVRLVRNYKQHYKIIT